MRMRKFVYAALMTAGVLAAAAPIAGATPTTTPTTTTPTAVAPTTSRPAPHKQPDGGDAWVSVNPGVAKPGQKVKVSFLCVGQDGGSHGKLTAPVLDMGPIKQLGENQAFEGTGTVKANTKPGTYTISYRCYDTTMKASLKVVDGNEKQQPPKQQVKVKPKGAAQTGGGATAL